MSDVANDDRLDLKSVAKIIHCKDHLKLVSSIIWVWPVYIRHDNLSVRCQSKGCDIVIQLDSFFDYSKFFIRLAMADIKLMNLRVRFAERIMCKISMILWRLWLCKKMKSKISKFPPLKSVSSLISVLLSNILIVIIIKILSYSRKVMTQLAFFMQLK